MFSIFIWYDKQAEKKWIKTKSANVCLREHIHNGPKNNLNCVDRQNNSTLSLQYYIEFTYVRKLILLTQIQIDKSKFVVK